MSTKSFITLLWVRVSTSRICILCFSYSDSCLFFFGAPQIKLYLLLAGAWLTEMLCIWLNNVSRLVFWQLRKCLSVAREVAKLFAWLTKYSSHFWRYQKCHWATGSFGNFGNTGNCLTGGLRIKGSSQCRNATGCSLITSYLFWQYFELFLCWLPVINIDATVVMWRRHWRHLQLEFAAWDCQPLGSSLSLSACLSVSQASRPTAGLTLSILAGDLNMLWEV